jgi:hypothetical protein
MNIADRVKQIIDNQQAKGKAKYGITVDDADLTIEQWIQHAQEEAADLMVYLEKIKQELRRNQS